MQKKLLKSLFCHSQYGHDKSQAIIPYRKLPEPPLLFFFGDGVSDMSAAKHADVLFVKTKEDGENDLHAYCDREGIKHILFPNFSHALNVVKDIVEGKTTPAHALEVGKA
jgi:2-hydroxy-3-keto-5-methylthiopentenyl-1-phosphate phosphatase